MSAQDAMEVHGQALVRKFTEEMEIQSDVESKTREAQRTLDSEAREAQTRQLRYYYETSGEDFS